MPGHRHGRRRLHHTIVAAAALAGGVGACDVFTARVPCGVDDECAASEACVEGFCAPDDGPGREGEGEGEPGEGEGEGEGESESHPLRGTECATIGSKNISDDGLRCSIFGVFEEPCRVDGDCGDPAAAHCVDPGAGPTFCAARADLRRSACPDNPGDADATIDGNVEDFSGCVDGSLTYVPGKTCGASATAFSGPSLLGGDLFVRLNPRTGEAEPCNTLEFLRFSPVAIGGTVHIGMDDDGVLGAVLPRLVSVPLDGTVAILGSYIIERTTSIQLPVGNDLERVLGDFVLVDNGAVDTVNLFSLVEVGGDVVIENNPALATIINTEPSRIGGNLVVRNNLLLPRCQLDPLIAAVEGTVTIEGVDDGATCP